MNTAAPTTEQRLRGVLEEFRTALREEIFAAQRSSSSNAVPLTSGRKIGQVGASFQYSFTIDSILNVPGDAPGDLIIPEKGRVPTTIVSTEGLTITVSVGIDLGNFVPIARLETDLTFLLRKLIERIEVLNTKSNCAGDRILGFTEPCGTLESVSVERLNAEQNAAVASTLGRDTTFIWGPPGTGKTETIGAIGAELFKRGRSALLVSHTNIAVDEALLKIANRLGDEANDGTVLRVGVPKEDKKFAAKPELLLATHVERRSAELASRSAALEQEQIEKTKESLGVQRLIAISEWLSEAMLDIQRASQDLGRVQRLEDEARTSGAKFEQLQGSESRWREVANEAVVIKQITLDANALRGLLGGLERAGTEIGQKVTDAKKRLEDAETLYNQSSAVGALTRLWKGLPKPEQQQAIVDSRKAELVSIAQERSRVTQERSHLQTRLEDASRRIEAFQTTHRASPDDLLAKHSAFDQQLKNFKDEADLRERTATEARDTLESLLGGWVKALREFGLIESLIEGQSHSASKRVYRFAPRQSAEDMLAVLQDGYERAMAEVSNRNLDELRRTNDSINQRLRQITAEIDAINEQLKRVEETIISEARIIATTLTRAYLRDTIQARRFDTVILDEASMAPIPALWVAASLADRNVIAVGDFKQLPPIVQSDKEFAVKWLGRDVFEIAGVTEAYKRQALPAHFVALKEQHRMHSDIRVIADQLFYDGILRDAPTVNNDEELDGWYRRDWGNDSPVLLVDTGSVGAWVTSVAKGVRTSRLNFLSATICVDLAERLLTGTPAVDRPRILIICPYSPHAKLLKLLIKTQNLEGQVEAGTVHSFQGSEAPIVIIDLVNDEPHWRVGMFNPSQDETSKRLLNVAVTRARRRLIVVGDFDYCEKRSKNAFLGREFLPFLRQFYKETNVLGVVSPGLSARAAQAQSVVVGGNVEPNSARIVLTQDTFYPIFLGDMGRARKHIVIYSPFMTADRLATVEPQLKAATERGVRVYVITKPQRERGAREIGQYQNFERTLTDWNVTVIHKIGMHEKLAFIDDEILWAGSLNPLSYSNTQEVMERRRSREVVKDFVSALRLKELIGAYEAGDDTCPICGREIMPAEGADDPFYWRCVEEGCYTRSIDDPPLRDGILNCRNCGGPVEFGEWGDQPAWRCVQNRHHHQRIHRNHLRLPRMRKLVPKRALQQLDRQFGIATERGQTSTTAASELELF
ncbi:MAG: hypothetical protein DME62_12730 [Verrucomicrobia bacterium]|nr:MAG: hypothetical protein DME62_12730 [Verrucomicrobiota bacterium]